LLGKGATGTAGGDGVKHAKAAPPMRNNPIPAIDTAIAALIVVVLVLA
jgi:hypothetical protein